MAMAEQPDTIDPLFKLRNSPLQGLEAYRSPFYRRLLSAGYKGYIQGSIGGATLLGLTGAALGGLFAGTLIVTGAVGAAAFAAVPAFALYGMKYGKEAFGNIGAIAAISAEQAEMSEKRRNLLDRYFETPSREEAREIERQLQGQAQERKPEKWFHWKTGLLGAVILAGIAVAGTALFAPQATAFLAELGINIFADAALGSSLTTLPGLLTIGGIAAAAGAFVGIDRAYIRKWFDAQEHFHDEQDVKLRRGIHNQEVERLQQAYRGEGFGLASRGMPTDITERDSTSRTAPISPRTVAQPNTHPGNTLSSEPNTQAKEEKPNTLINASDAEYQQRAVNVSSPVASL